MDARQDIGIRRRQWVSLLPLRTGRIGHIHIAVRPFLVVLQPARRIVHRSFPLRMIRRARRRRPVPTGVGALPAVEEVVEGHEPLRQRMVVGRDRTGKKRQLRIAIGVRQVAQHLIIGAVFLHDVDHVADVRLQEGHGLEVRGIRLGHEAVVLGHLAGELTQCRRRRRGQGQKARLFKLPHIGVRAGAGLLGDRRVAAAGADIGARVALTVDHIDLLAVRAHGHRRRIPAGRDQADHVRAGRIRRIVIVLVSFRRGFRDRAAHGDRRQGSDRHGVFPAIGDEQRLAVR